MAHPRPVLPRPAEQWNLPRASSLNSSPSPQLPGARARGRRGPRCFQPRSLSAPAVPPLPAPLLFRSRCAPASSPVPLPLRFLPSRPPPQNAWPPPCARAAAPAALPAVHARPSSLSLSPLPAWAVRARSRASGGAGAVPRAQQPQGRRRERRPRCEASVRPSAAPLSPLRAPPNEPPHAPPDRCLPS